MKTSLCIFVAVILSLVGARTFVSADPVGKDLKVNVSQVTSLDGDKWSLATDPKNVGQNEKWWEKSQPGARDIKVPWIIQDTFIGYSGIVWYWRQFDAPVNPNPDGRYLLRFSAVDYKADVWLNGVNLGVYESGDVPFVIDATDAIKPGAANLLSLRVLIPGNKRIDDIVLDEVPHHCKAEPYCAGYSYNYGGIMDSVELLAVPSLRVDDLFVRPDCKTGEVRVRLNVFNAHSKQISGDVELSIGPMVTGEIISAQTIKRNLAVGKTVIEAVLKVDKPRLWDIKDPYLYRVTARVCKDGASSYHEMSARCGFRDFRFENGYFRLNGRRIYIRSTHTANHGPVGLRMPIDPDFFRRDMLNLKVMGFNTVRFLVGTATRYQLDLCDEIGLMVYEEPLSSWFLGDSPKMAERYDRSLSGMILRDCNHPSIVMWGLLNETMDGLVFRHAVSALPLVRKLDDSRIVMLNSGRFDISSIPVGVSIWKRSAESSPSVTCNCTDKPIYGFGPINSLSAMWKPGQLALTPGEKGDYSVVRWTAPAAGNYEVSAAFTGATYAATTDVHVLAAGKSIFDSGVNINGLGSVASFVGKVNVRAGETVDFIVGYGNGNNCDDTTTLTATIKESDGQVWDAAGDFKLASNPNGPWSYGCLAAGDKPDISTIKLYEVKEVVGIADPVGGLSNPGSHFWEDLVKDQHDYPRVPHTADVISMLRTMDGGKHNIFLSEYGVGSAVDLVRVARHYEQLGKTDVEDALFYRGCLDKFMIDWDRWHLADTWASPEEYFKQAVAKMSAERIRGISALRSNPNIISYSLTGAVDQGMCGEGLANTFRELKPGAVDAINDVFAPLRLCLFVEPYNIYRDSKVKLDAVLANEDVLKPGDYPIRLQVIGPDHKRVFEKTVTVTIPSSKVKVDLLFALPIYSIEVSIDGPCGKYRFLAAFEKGGAATGGETEFYVADASEMPKCGQEIVLWGDDPTLANWLAEHGIKTRRFPADGQTEREVILVGEKPADGGVRAWSELAQHIARGSTVIFLSPGVFAKGDQLPSYLPLANKGTIERLRGWLYLKDEWAKTHPIFDGLPCGGFMDYTFYREIIPDLLFVGQDSPDEVVAGATKTARGYRSGLFTSVYNMGAGKFILNTLQIDENLNKHPAAERLLRNMLNYAARDVQQPVERLPDDFDEQLKAIGYE
ncbi:MAG: glycoside hydrolase family 2 protein [Armatimonadota bacterium]